jgi:hypothetical protein
VTIWLGGDYNSERVGAQSGRGSTTAKVSASCTEATQLRSGDLLMISRQQLLLVSLSICRRCSVRDLMIKIRAFINGLKRLLSERPVTMYP